MLVAFVPIVLSRRRELRTPHHWHHNHPNAHATSWHRTALLGSPRTRTRPARSTVYTATLPLSGLEIILTSLMSVCTRRAPRLLAFGSYLTLLRISLACALRIPVPEGCLAGWRYSGNVIPDKHHGGEQEEGREETNRQARPTRGPPPPTGSQDEPRRRTSQAPSASSPALHPSGSASSGDGIVERISLRDEQTQQRSSVPSSRPAPARTLEFEFLR